MKKTAIIILNYNNPSDTIACIKSVERYNTAPVKYVIVDNGSTDGVSVPEIDAFLSGAFAGEYKRVREADAVSGTLPHVTFLTSLSNDGYARGNNKGIALTADDDEIDRLMILNNDILFIEDIIPALKEAQDHLPACAIISPLLLNGKGSG
ncbi:MAG: glycosyltransferase, partial [Duncaniella sp.]|nr:glycosyltransferase [Duncaniella sp.]